MLQDSSLGYLCVNTVTFVSVIYVYLVVMATRCHHGSQGKCLNCAPLEVCNHGYCQICLHLYNQ